MADRSRDRTASERREREIGRQRVGRSVGPVKRLVAGEFIAKQIEQIEVHTREYLTGCPTGCLAEETLAWPSGREIDSSADGAAGWRLEGQRD